MYYSFGYKEWAQPCEDCWEDGTCSMNCGPSLGVTYPVKRSGEMANRKVLWDEPTRIKVAKTIVDIEERCLKEKTYPTQLQILTEAQATVFGKDMSKWRSMANPGDTFKLLKDDLAAERLRRMPKIKAEPPPKGIPPKEQIKEVREGAPITQLVLDPKGVRMLMEESANMFVEAFAKSLSFKMADHLSNLLNNMVTPIAEQVVQRAVAKEMAQIIALQKGTQELLIAKLEASREVMREDLEKQTHKTLDMVQESVRHELQSGETLGMMEVAVQRAFGTVPDPGVAHGVGAPPVEEPQGTVNDKVTLGPLGKVCIIGLQPKQEEEIRRAFADAIDITFIRPSDSRSGGTPLTDVEAKVRKSDMCIMMEKSGRWAYQAVKKAGVKHATVQGSVSGLGMFLQQWYNSQGEANANG
jgi:hypothetical protein